MALLQLPQRAREGAQGLERETCSSGKTQTSGALPLPVGAQRDAEDAVGPDAWDRPSTDLGKGKAEKQKQKKADRPGTGSRDREELASRRHDLLCALHGVNKMTETRGGSEASEIYVLQTVSSLSHLRHACRRI